jgi:tight adherence protein B
VAGLPHALDTVAGGLRAGLTLIQALERAATGPPVAEDLRGVVDRARSGSGLANALAEWARVRPLPEVSVVVGALEVALAAGGPAAGALEGLAESLRDRRGTVEESRALSAQARLSAVIVGAAPVVSVGLSAAVDRRLLAALLAPGSGRTCLAAGLSLEILAAAWMRRILEPG